MKHSKNITKTFSHLTQFLFLGCVMVLLYLPLIVMMLIPSLSLPNREKRELSPLPDVPQSLQDSKEYLDSFTNYFEDNFGLRNNYILYYSVLNTVIFQTSPHKDVTLGKNMYLFYFEDYTKRYYSSPYFSQQQGKRFKDMLTYRKQWYDEQGIDLLFMIVPNKVIIYPEYYREGSIVPFYKENYDTIYQYLQTTDIVTVNPKETLLGLKEHYSQQIYYTADTHWTSIGAYGAYRDIIYAMKSNFGYSEEPYFLDDFTMEIVPHEKPDLAEYINLHTIYKDERYSLTPTFETCANPHVDTKSEIVTQYICEEKQLKALLIGDSFSWALSSFLQHHFKELVFVRHSAFFDSEYIEEYQPDIIIWEIVERFLSKNIPNNVTMEEAKLIERTGTVEE